MDNQRTKKHAFYMVVLFIILLLYLNKFIINIESVYWGEYMIHYPVRAQMYKFSVEEYNDFLPLWQPFTMSGEPYFAEAGTQVFYLITLLNFIIPNTVVAVKIVAIINLFLIGISIYSLVFYLLKSHRCAFISALVFMFNGWTVSRFAVAHLTTLSALPFLPLIILFTLKATKSKEWINYSIITGLLFSIQIFAGPDLKVTLWTVPLFVLCLISHTIGKGFSKRLTKVALIGIIVLLVTAGLTAVKVLPTKEYIDLSSRERMAFELTIAGKIGNIKQGFKTLIEPLNEGTWKIQEGKYQIGIIASVLMILAIWKKPKNKNVLLFTSMIIFSLFIVSGSFIWYLIWRYVPAYGSFRYLDRTIVMFVFSASVLAGIGVNVLFETVEKRGWQKNKRNVLFLSILLLIIINLLIFGSSTYRKLPFRNPSEIIKQNNILQYISKEKGIFRLHILETTGIDWNTDFQTVPLNIKTIYGGSGMWLTEYMNEYLNIALNQPAKFWGIINVKYLTSRKQVNMTGFKFIRKFDPCDNCWPEREEIQKIWGPYLYENELFMPNAYIVNNAILVIGEKNAAKQTMYAIMLNDNFDPSKNIIILAEKTKVSDYTIDFLKRFKFIFLVQGSIGQNDGPLLKQYAGLGGIILPNIIEGKNTISNEDIDNMLNYPHPSNRAIKDENVITRSFDEREVKLDNDKGNFLVLSERYSLFPGWRAKAGGKNLEILRTNGVVSSVYLDDNFNSVIFEYKPKSYRDGLIITIITILLVTGYFIYDRFLKNETQKTH